MNSTSTSDLLLEAQGLGIDYPVEIYSHQGMRDVFVQTLQHPWEWFTRPRDMLPVLRDVNLQLRQGDRLGLIGMNGSGKTTLCRLLCGMLRPRAGEIRAHGRVEAIFDTGTGVLPELTGRENAHLLAALMYGDRPLTKAAVEEALTFSELGFFLDTPFKTYSKGMQARLLLSLVSASTSDVLILDEVFDGADIFFREKIRQRMRAKIERSGAVIFVSHGTEQVRELCNRVMVLDKGAVVFDGAPDEGIEKYLAQSGQFGR